ncbi:MAG: ABC transporter ATP-binding protein, partial [Haloferacaceae archaeon]
MSLLSVENLAVEYATADGPVRAVDGVSLDVDSRSIVGVLGESGCGKSTLAKSLVRGLPDNARIPGGSVVLDGEDIASVSEKRLRELRWDTIAYVPQSAMGSLDPVYTVRQQLLETIDAHRTDVSKREANARAEEVLETVGISPSRLDDYPHQLSGGMRQRVILAMSLLLEPDLIIADEPTTGLDVLIRDKVLADIERYRDEFDISVIFVSHDIADLVETSDELLVMYGGKIVERGPSRSLFEEPIHPYTIGLKNSLPELHSDPDEMVSMSMNPPDLRDPPDGCRFVEKCPYAVEECRDSHPGFAEMGGGVQTACYRADEAAELRAQATEVNWAHDE